VKQVTLKRKKPPVFLLAVSAFFAAYGKTSIDQGNNDGCNHRDDKKIV